MSAAYLPQEGNTVSLAALERAVPRLALRDELLPQMWATMADAILAARAAPQPRQKPPRGFTPLPLPTPVSPHGPSAGAACTA